MLKKTTTKKALAMLRKSLSCKFYDSTQTPDARRAASKQMASLLLDCHFSFAVEL
jgi:hypothetical protein